jgi:hypothetical protein
VRSSASDTRNVVRYFPCLGGPDTVFIKSTVEHVTPNLLSDMSGQSLWNPASGPDMLG